MKNFSILKLTFYSLLLLGYIQTFGQASSFQAFQVNSKNFTFDPDQNQNFEVSTAFKYDLGRYKDYEIRIRYEKTGILYTNEIPATESNIVFNSPVGQMSDATYNYVTFHVDNSKLINDAKEHSISMQFQTFRNILVNTSCTADISQQILFEVYGVDKSCTANCNKTLLGTDYSTISIPKVKDNNNTYLAVNTYRLQPEVNYYTPVVSEINASYNNAAYTSVNLKIEYPADKLEYRLISEYAAGSFNFTSSQSPIISQNSSVPGIILLTVNRNINFRIYFAPKMTQMNVNLGVKVTMTGTGSGCGGVALSINRQVQDTQSVNLDYNAEVSFKPVIEGPSTSETLPCVSNCNFAGNSTIISFEANSLYSNANALSNVRVTVPVDVQLSRLDFESIQYGAGVSPTLSYHAGNDVFDLPANGSSFSFPANTIIDYFTISGLDLPSKAKDFDLVFVHKTSASTSDKLFTFSYINNVSSTDMRGTKGVTVTNPATKPCENRTYVWDNYRTANYNQGSTFSLGGNGYVVLVLRPYDLANPTNFTFDFDYTLQSYMKFANTTLKFAKNNQENSPPPGTSGYQNVLNSILSSNDWTLAPGGYIKIVGNKIQVRGLKLKNSCSASKITMLYVLASVKIDLQVPKDNYSSTFEDKGTNGNNIWSAASWTVPAFFNLSGEIYLSCNDQNFPGGNVKRGDVISVRYLLKNTSTDALFGFVVKGKSLKFGSSVLTPASVDGYILDINNTKISVASTDLPYVLTNSGEDITVTVNNTLKVSGFQKLIIDVKYAIPQNLSVNVQNVSSFSVKAANTNEVNSDPIDISVSTNSVCGIVLPPEFCAECVTSFSPVPGQRYLLSAWVKEEITGIVPTAYVNSGIKITFNNGAIADLPVFKGVGPVIDGWQRIEQSFVVPQNAQNIQIQLMSENKSVEVYFDDIRIHPFRSNMKSFVYDPSSQRLTAELDENNYATFYEYDDEGILIRVKKETERGVMTIKESRNNQSKIFKNGQ